MRTTLVLHDTVIFELLYEYRTIKPKNSVLVPNYLEAYQRYGETRSTSKENAFDWSLKNHNVR